MNDVFWFVIETVVNLCQSLMFTYFVYKFLSPKENIITKLYFILSWALQFVLITVADYITFFKTISPLLYSAGLFVSALFMLNGSIIKKIIASVIPAVAEISVYTLILKFFEAISNMNMTETTKSIGELRLIMIITVQITTYFILNVLIRLLGAGKDEAPAPGKKHKKGTGKYSIPVSDSIIIIVVTVSSLTISLLLSLISIEGLNYSQRFFLNISVIMLAVLNIFVFYITDSMIKKNSYKKQVEIYKLKEQYQNQYINNADLQYETIRKIKHDIKGQLSAIYTLLEAGDISSALSLIDENHKAMKSVETYIATDNPIVNAIINSKLTIASAMGIQVSCISVRNFDGIDDIDLCNLLSNLLDNAIQACLKLPEDADRYINLFIEQEESIYTLTVKNSISGSVLKSNPELKTTKSDKEKHGIGIKTIRGISEDYDGRCDFYETGNQFCSQVNLKKRIRPLV